MTPSTGQTGDLRISAASIEGQDRILDPEAMSFLGELARRFDGERKQLVARREERQARFDAGEAPDFSEETRTLRQGDWTVAPIPEELRDRRVEITGPVDRKMVINALNSGARVFMADFEDSSAPSWRNMIEGQVNLRDAVRRTIEFTSPEGKEYRLNDDPAILFVRPRGLHLPERHLLLGEQPIGGSLMDAALYLYHNAREALDRGTGPYLYLPKLEHYLEARWWNQVLEHCEDTLGLERGMIKVTVLIETLPATFQMDEILHELRQRIVGLNCGRWDYIFSFIKVFRAHADRVLPDRSQVTMTVEFLRAYSRRLIGVCHRRGALAMGGMAAQIPVRNDEEANRKALDAVRRDKEREAGDGHDGTWVAHPALVPLAMEVFDRLMPGPNQLDRFPDELPGREALLAQPEGTITEDGVRGNIEVAIRYLAAWLCGQGCVPINFLMEDAATAEIARAQLWQWIHNDGVVLEDGRSLDQALYGTWFEEICESLRGELGEESWNDGRFGDASRLLDRLVRADRLEEFLTLPAYDMLEEEL